MTGRRLMLASSLLTLLAGTGQLFARDDGWHHVVGAILVLTSFLWLAAFVRSGR